MGSISSWGRFEARSRDSISTAGLRAAESSAGGLGELATEKERGSRTLASGG